jgi:hypothetical protein
MSSVDQDECHIVGLCLVSFLAAVADEVRVKVLLREPAVTIRDVVKARLEVRRARAAWGVTRAEAAGPGVLLHPGQPAPLGGDTVEGGG